MSCTLAATFNGYIYTTYDALIVFEACLSDKLSRALRRPTDDERRELIQSGKVFIYKEEPGMKRWTDGVFWSPSRALGNFLVYRELKRPLESSNERQTLKKHKQMGTDANPKSQSPLHTKHEDWWLIGSLVDSYDFKQDGLVKKTIKITFQEAAYHLVCYYKCEDIKRGFYTSPSRDPMLQGITPRNDLMRQEFKAPIFESAEAGGIYNHLYGPVQMNYDYSSTQFLAQPQHEQLQYLMAWLLPYHSNEQQEAS
ncbi:Global transcription regulator sge1 [Fusarium solani]